METAPTLKAPMETRPQEITPIATTPREIMPWVATPIATIPWAEIPIAMVPWAEMPMERNLVFERGEGLVIWVSGLKVVIGTTQNNLKRGFKT